VQPLVPAADGLQLPAVWVLPPGFDANKKYPLILSVYGGPGARSVLDTFPRRLDDHFLAQEGIIVLAVDHRGAGHFGKKGMAAMHRCLGKWEIADYSAAVAWLRHKPFIDSSRIGISGGSAALRCRWPWFRRPMSSRHRQYSVTDWSLTTRSHRALHGSASGKRRLSSGIGSATRRPTAAAVLSWRHGRQRPYAELAAAPRSVAGRGKNR
jgi:hypothetical protein